MNSLSQLVGWILAGFYSLVPNFGVAIILLGLTFMILVVPLTLKSTRSMLAMQRLQPKMKQLQQQHKNDRMALNQALTELYKQEGVSPFGSCIPTLLPLPLFYVLYRVIIGLGNKGPSGCKGDACHAMPLYINPGTEMYKALVASAPPGEGAQMHAFGINLSVSAWSALTKSLGVWEVFGSLLLLLIMIGANYYQQVQITNLNPMVRQNQQVNPQMQMMRFFPIVFGLICIRLPSGLVLYYAVSALFRVGQQWTMYQYDPKVKALVARDDHDIDVMEARIEEADRPRQKSPQSQKSPPTQPGSQKSKPSPKSLPPGDGVGPSDGKATGDGKTDTGDEKTNGDGKTNGQRPTRSPTAQSSGQRSRNRKRKGR